MLIAEPWYESGSFWQFAITTLVAVAVGALGAFATLRANNPKRRLTFKTLANTSLFVASHSQTGALAVTHNGTHVARPRVIELQITNLGSRDITSGQFHGGDPITFDLGADVVAVLEVTSPFGGVTPPVAIDATTPSKILIAPCLLVRRRGWKISLLVDGPEAEVTCLAPLVDVNVRQSSGADTSPWTLFISIAAFLLLVGFGLGVVATDHGF